MPKLGYNLMSSRLFGDYGAAQSAYSGFFDYKLTTALPRDFVGDFKAAPAPQALIVPVADNVPDTITANNPVLTVGAAPIVSTINTLEDQDYYKVTLTAGVTYDIGMYQKAGGPSGVPLPDSYIEVYDASGNLVVDADGNGPNTPQGLDALLAFTPSESGVYYVNARAFDQDSTNGDGGDGIGDYEIFVSLTPADGYHPYYDPRSPLYAIDWGTMVDKVNTTARNPDGNEGIRPTGNPQGTPTQAGQFHYDPDGDGPQPMQVYDAAGLAAVQGKSITGKNVITIYFARPGDTFVSNNPANPGLPPATITAVALKDFEYKAVWTSLGEFAKVADIVYLEVSDRNDADFIYTSYTGTPGPGISLLGSMSPPGEDDEGLAQFNSGDERWNQRDLAQGGFSFVTLIHEFGHGHGLAHPHDNGGHSGVMHGVESEGVVADYTTGDYDLNQGVYTMMSYEDGWQTSPYGNAETDVGYGYLGGLMAFDIAAIQDKYGVNEDYATGDDTYTLKDVNEAGTYFTSIWDAGGTDQIVYTGTRDANIDLRPATLQYEPGGGGWVSYAYGIYGGFTVANGVTIENATSGSGNDKLTGNDANNRLDGGAGNDTLIAGNGTDTLLGGDGNDLLYFGGALTAGDIADGGAGRDVLVLQGNYTLTLSATNMANLESISLQTGTRPTWGDTAGNLYDFNITTNDANVAAGQQMIVNAQSLHYGEDFTFNGSAETDGKFLVYGGRGVDTLTGGANGDVFFFEGDRWGPEDRVDGGGGRDSLVISAGNGFSLVQFGENSLTNIESVSLNARYASDASARPSYKLVLANGNVAPGATLIVNANSLADPGQFVIVDGSAVHDGQLTIFGGAGVDTLIGGAGADILAGGLGVDYLTGGGGADTFRLLGGSDATPATPDQILDFVSGTDKIDLSAVDADTLTAGDQAFHWIGSNAFTGGGASSAGELRAWLYEGSWYVEGDTNGDGLADLVIAVVTPAAPVVQGDFLL